MSVKSSCSPDDNSEELSRRLLEMCDDAMRQLCIPANDREFYEVCFLVPVRESLSSLSTLNGREYSNNNNNNNNNNDNNNNNNNNSERSLRCELEGRYSSLMSLYRHLDRHRAATVRVLQLCQHRDELVKEMLRICEDYQAEATGQRSPPAPPALFARAMEEHHIVTLFLLEAIFDWREQLSRPFPFVVAQENYLYRILDDCRLIDASLLGNVMRPRLTEYPLGSYRSSGSGTGGGASRLGRKKTPFICDSGNGNNNSSSINTSTGGGSLVEGDKTSVTVHMHGGGCSPVGRSMTLDGMRLKWGESVIKTEHVLQRRLACELTSMLSQGLFVTVLATPDIVRGAADGLPLVIDNKHTVWRGRVVTEAAELTATGRDDATAEEEEADVLPQQSDASLEIITHTNESSM